MVDRKYLNGFWLKPLSVKYSVKWYQSSRKRCPFSNILKHYGLVLRDFHSLLCLPGSCSSVCPDLFFKALVRDLCSLMCLACFQSRQLLRKAFSQAVPLHYCERKLSARALTHLPPRAKVTAAGTGTDRQTDRVSCHCRALCLHWVHWLETHTSVGKPQHLLSHCLINITVHFIGRGRWEMPFVSFQTIHIFVQYRTCSMAGIWKLYLDKHVFS